MKTARGDCFRWATQWAMRQSQQVAALNRDTRGYGVRPEPTVVHGSVVEPVMGAERHAHAWVEWDGRIYDWQQQVMRRPSLTQAEFNRTYQPNVDARYTPVEALALALRTKHWGPYKRRSFLGAPSGYVLYSGTRKWEGPPEVRGGKKGRAEYGPGIYLTTSLETAKKYAKGGGSVRTFTLAPDIRWLEQASLPMEDVHRALSAAGRGAAQRKKVLEDVLRYAHRAGVDTSSGQLPASVLVNLMVNHDLTSGENGAALAAFLVLHGIDASLVPQSGEDWVVLFNPKKVERVERTQDGEPWDLPRIRL